ncbi:hypothetical protein ACYZTM_02435 [Pseudomonas sp. MDT2-39-1]
MGGVFAALLNGCGDEPKSPAMHSEAADAMPTDAELALIAFMSGQPIQQ